MLDRHTKESVHSQCQELRFPIIEIELQELPYRLKAATELNLGLNLRLARMTSEGTPRAPMQLPPIPQTSRLARPHQLPQPMIPAKPSRAEPAPLFLHTLSIALLPIPLPSLTRILPLRTITLLPLLAKTRAAL